MHVLDRGDRGDWGDRGDRAAGATAAYLLEQWLPDGCAVLVTRGTGAFRGEDDREMGFRATLRALAPSRRQVDLVDATGDGEVLREAQVATPAWTYDAAMRAEDWPGPVAVEVAHLSDRFGSGPVRSLEVMV